MAQKVLTLLISDLSGDELPEGSGETVTFGLDGKQYEIDLTTKEAAALRKSLDRYVDSARRVGRKTGTAGARTQIGPSAKLIREWAKSNGHEVPDRGRVPQEVRDAYDAAH